MGGKSQPVPEAYDLEELLKYNTDLNRYDAENPFGTQRWEEQPNGRWKMYQEPSPLLQGMMHDQFDYVNRGPEYVDTPKNLDSAYQRLTGKMMEKHDGTRNYAPDIPEATPPDPSTYRTERPELEEQTEAQRSAELAGTANNQANMNEAQRFLLGRSGQQGQSAQAIIDALMRRNG